ncbi:MAG: aldo/keto reductase [Hyphomicrobiaceae bacterium]
MINSGKKNTPKAILLIQCRLASSRLPGKGLLPIAGMPAILLCARRAANTGLNIRVLTTVDSSDDQLSYLLAENNIEFLRGHPQNVLERFVMAVENLNEMSTPIVRLTADNLFIDGNLIDEMLEVFHAKKLNYLTLNPPSITGAPHGLSLEIFSLSALRVAYEQAADSFDREHVTPAIVRKEGLNAFSPKNLKKGQAHLRCTMDTWTDYLTLHKVFEAVTNPVNVSWNTLCDKLHEISPSVGIPTRYSKNQSISELSLGTAQFGLSYGIANSEGQVNPDTASDLLSRAVEHGVTHIDCAAAYGEAENVVGKAMDAEIRSRTTVITKLLPLQELDDRCSDADLRAHVEASIYRSCHQLGIASLPFLLLHRWNHRRSHSGRIWQCLKELQAKGVVQHLGASVQNPMEANEAIVDPDVKFIQLPFNLLDRRFQKSGFPGHANFRQDVIIQARSVLLQGLLVLPSTKWPRLPRVKPLEIEENLQRLVILFNRESVIDLAIAYVRAQNWIDCLVIGIQNSQQLQKNISLFQKSPLTEEECVQVENLFPHTNEQLLDPSKWISR